ncbi:MAG: type II toxin-antitoxin system VapC family toxin [Candidatus Levyibacteriota bacterium]
MPYLIDSDLVIDHLLNIKETTQLLEALAKDGTAISIITYMETYQNVIRNHHSQEAKEIFQNFIETIPVLSFSLHIAQRCAHLRERLKIEGKRVNSRAFDLINASIALEYNLILVTRNRNDYKDIPGLKLFRP